MLSCLDWYISTTRGFHENTPIQSWYSMYHSTFVAIETEDWINLDVASPLPKNWFFSPSMVSPLFRSGEATSKMIRSLFSIATYEEWYPLYPLYRGLFHESLWLWKYTNPKTMPKHYFWTSPFKRNGFTTGETQKNRYWLTTQKFCNWRPADNYGQHKHSTLWHHTKRWPGRCLRHDRTW